MFGPILKFNCGRDAAQGNAYTPMVGVSELPQFIEDERPDTNRSFLVFPNYIVTNKCGVFV